MTRRRLAGAIVALLGAVAVTASAYLDWLRDRAPEEMPLDRLFQTSVEGDAASYWRSVALPLAVVTLLAVLGTVLLSRLLFGLGLVLGVAVLLLWFVMESLDDTAEGFGFADLQTGVWICVAGLVVMLVGLVAMGRREVETGEPLSVFDTDHRDEQAP